MTRLMLAALVTAFAIGTAAAQGTCESRAVGGQDGKPLAGAAKTSFLVKCKREACAPKVVGSDGKPHSSSFRWIVNQCLLHNDRRRLDAYYVSSREFCPG